MLLRYLLIAVIGYAIGCISSAYFVGKIFANIDIRDHGSGNAGATNMLRVVGVWPSILTLVCDMLKGVLAVIIGRHFGLSTGAYVCAVAELIGHNWPFYLNFKGGKGIASTIGIMIALDYRIGLILVAAGIIAILITRYVSLGSLIGAALYPIIVCSTQFSNTKLVIFSFIIAVLAFFRHRENIKRLIQGNERKLGVNK